MSGWNISEILDDDDDDDDDGDDDGFNLRKNPSSDFVEWSWA